MCPTKFFHGLAESLHDGMDHRAAETFRGILTKQRGITLPSLTSPNSKKLGLILVTVANEAHEPEAQLFWK